MFEDEVNGFLQEIELKVKRNPHILPANLMIEDEGWDHFEELKRILERMDIRVLREEEKGLVLDVQVFRDLDEKIRFFQGDEEIDFHHLYFVLRRNGLIRIDTMQITH